MKLFERKQKNENSEVAVTGVPQLYNNRFSNKEYIASLCDSYSRFLAMNKQLYGNLRKSVPVIDGAIGKIVRLTGGFSVKCSDRKAQKQLDDFLKSVNVGGNLCGLDAFVDTFLDQLLTYGTAVGEMILNQDNRSFSLFNGEIDNIILERNKNNPLHIDICTYENGRNVPVKNPQRVVLSVLDPEAGNLHGNSVLRGLPFVSSVLLQIFETIGTNWERVGNLRYAVTYKPQNDAMDKAYAKERAMQILKAKLYDMEVQKQMQEIDKKIKNSIKI